MAQDVRIAVDLANLANLGPLVRAAVFGQLQAAVQMVVETGEERWREAVQAAPLWQGERDAYAASITSRMTGAFSGEITSDYRYVEDIETGRPAYDLKRMLNTSMKVRVSKTGKRYLIIPIRHGVPESGQNPMPANVYAQARQLAPSRVIGQGQRVSGTGAFDLQARQPVTVAARKYVWGGRLAPGARQLGSAKRDPHAGMVRFDTSSGKSKSSTYLTFRVMVEGSSGWVVGARPGLWIASAVGESLQRMADVDFPTAVEADLAAA